MSYRYRISATNGRKLRLSAARKANKGKNLAAWRKRLAENKTNALEDNIPKSEESSVISGRRIIDIQYFISQVQDSSNKHILLGCTFSDMQMLSERRNGLNTGITMKCRMCNYTKVFWTDDPQSPAINVNTAAVAGIMSIGGGFSNMEKFFSALNIPSMSEETFINEQEKLSEGWKVTALNGMESAVYEERSQAIQCGDVDSEARTVVVDASGFKCSNKTNFASLSGVGSGTPPKEDKKDHIPLEPNVEIKEEPTDYLPGPSTSTDPLANEEFILPHEDNSWTTASDSVVEPQFTLSVASLGSGPDTTDSEQPKKKRKTNDSTVTALVPSTNGPATTPQSPIYNFGEFSTPGSSSKEQRAISMVHPKDHFDVFGEYIAAKLRNLDRISCAFAQKAIGDIIFEAEMGKYLGQTPNAVLNSAS